MCRLWWLALAAAVLVIAGPLAPGPVCGQDFRVWAEVDEPLPSFELEDLDGNVLRSSDLEGKVVVIDFWATWCAPCLQELPDLAAYHERLAGREDVALLSFNVTDERKDVDSFVERHGTEFPVYSADALVEPLDLLGFPTKLIVDARGGTPMIRFRRIGAVPIESIEAKVAELLER